MPGAENVNASIGPKWANVANMPFRFWKATMYEGGICTPAIAYWPKGMKIKHGSVTNETCHIIDVMATCLELSGAVYPKSYNGHSIIPLAGISFASILKSGKRNRRHAFLGFEHYREKALITAEGLKIVQRQRHGEWEWELYDLKTDRTEMCDLAVIQPEKMRELVTLFKDWAKEVSVIPSPEPLWGGFIDEF